MHDKPDSEIRGKLKLTNAEELYQIKTGTGSVIDYEDADGRELFNHYRHRMTNYDQVLDEIHDKQGRVTGWQQKQAAVGAAEQVLEKYRDEHVKVIRDSQKKGHVLKNLMQKAGVSTALALTQLLDSWSEKIKEVSQLEDSQKSLRIWNDTYRVHRELVKRVLIHEGVSKEVIDKVNAIYSTRSVNKAIELGSALFDLERSEILSWLKKAIRYTKLL